MLLLNITVVDYLAGGYDDIADTLAMDYGVADVNVAGVVCVAYGVCRCCDRYCQCRYVCYVAMLARVGVVYVAMVALGLLLIAL